MSYHRVSEESQSQPLTFKGTKDMSKEPSGVQKNIGHLAPKLAQLTDDVLFGDVWERAELSKRDRSLITVAALIAGGNTEQLRFHLKRAKDNGVTEAELIETITHLAFYAGWPRAMSAMNVAKEVFQSSSVHQG
jgi:4-carboxymuconolactone decarboxylase